MRLLRKHGVLAGLNLREVAQEAKVARGLVYHHFGSRRSLLRSALSRSVLSRRSAVVRREKLRARERLEAFFSWAVKDPESIQLMTLLILDGDQGVSALPYAEYAREANVRDVGKGLLADDIDVDALQAGLLAATYGWAVYRRSFAAALGRAPEDLDADVLEMIARMWEPRGGPKGEPGDD
nr:TetR/AcrR family transcriptional regulator [Amycolatopsis jejuensis]